MEAADEQNSKKEPRPRALKRQRDVLKRRREVAEVMCTVEHGPVWEYRLRREIRSERPLIKTLGGDGSLGAAAIVCGECPLA